MHYGDSVTSPVNAFDPLVMLATGLHAKPGVYAVLLGSGVSTGAGIPTGWGVVQQLVRRAAAALDPGDDGAAEAAEADPEAWWGSTDAVKRILGGVSIIAGVLVELRNRGYGTGHGPAGARVGLRPRHAHLAVNAAFTWCQLMLDTLADPEGPWRNAAGG